MLDRLLEFIPGAINEAEWNTFYCHAGLSGIHLPRKIPDKRE